MTTKWRSDESQLGFRGWVRNNPELDSSRNGLYMMDSDLWVHQFRRYEDAELGARDVQCIMLVEFKEHGRACPAEQKDTMHIINQLLRNRRNTSDQFQADDARLVSAYSLKQKKMVTVWSFGVHSLVIHGGDGTYLQWRTLTWDGKHEIAAETLTGLLRFDIDPDTLGAMDLRRHHKTHEKISLEITDLGFEVERTVTKRS